MAKAALSATKYMKKLKNNEIKVQYGRFFIITMPGLFLGQRISIAIQGSNAANFLGTFLIDVDADEFFDAL